MTLEVYSDFAVLLHYRRCLRQVSWRHRRPTELSFLLTCLRPEWAERMAWMYVFLCQMAFLREVSLMKVQVACLSGSLIRKNFFRFTS